ncbi:hypothetical protein A3A60_01725 [Candidatus Curtissbacteria bacterium RIFCSPLOWO2_01_FULL_42_26]|uniref:Uncharacterized protein n=1 Tax=Candidatus Curtissbacteria bacterium RIFCSPLOWO2_01_FULL_42_26 TaxID=1797729 RepID=A0A1F5HZN0_9BACT|nr:MAG: hypothetical protein A3A60_01725 [Candidatus Curtissbacteria bacterium RIFCSPLOWO2_01_FULL_42_26]
MAVETVPQDHGDESGASDMISEGSPPADFMLSQRRRETDAFEPKIPSGGDQLEPLHPYTPNELDHMGG